MVNKLTRVCRTYLNKENAQMVGLFVIPSMGIALLMQLSSMVVDMIGGF